MERIFNNGNSGVFNSGLNPSDDEDTYHAFVKAMIDDSVDYEESFLGPIREQNQAYYYGELPAIKIEEGEEEDEIQQSQAVSTDVRDTVMAIMPSLMRTFAGGVSHCVDYVANKAEEVEAAKQATEYVHYKFWDENGGFLKLHGAIKDCLTVKVGVLTWWSETTHTVEHKTFQNVSLEQVAAMVDAGQQAGIEPEIVEMSDISPQGRVSEVTIKYIQARPRLMIDGVAPENFRISRRAKNVQTADLVGHEEIVRASVLIDRGFDPELIMEYAGQSFDVSEERSMRNGYADQYDVIGDLVLYGEFYVRIDSDGDGINELHWIKTIGDDRFIIEDTIVPRARYALFQSDPRPHTAVGDCPADLVLEIQDIKTSILRGSLDSLADVLNPRTGVNETLVNMSDVLNTDRGAIIRTKGMPKELIQPLTTEFVGAMGFEMMDRIDQVRQARTGISEASKGMDPKALQSTTLMGVDAIVTGAQERIELIARILAETGMKDLFTGLLQEIVDNPSPAEVLEIRGSYTEFNPSLFPANMRCRVNPSIGKGSDQSRMTTLMSIRDMQIAIIEKYGFDNPVVGIPEIMNTTEDLLALANIRNMSRYFKPVSEEQIRAIAAAPKEPTPEQMIAQAEVEKNKKDVVIKTAELKQRDAQAQMDDDFRRDKLNVDAILEVASIFKDMNIAKASFDKDIRNENQAP